MESQTFWGSQEGGPGLDPGPAGSVNEGLDRWAGSLPFQSREQRWLEGGEAHGGTGPCVVGVFYPQEALRPGLRRHTAKGCLHLPVLAIGSPGDGVLRTGLTVVPKSEQNSLQKTEANWGPRL